MKIETSFITNKGTIREANEDSLLVSRTLINNTDMNEIQYKLIEENFLFAVADGMGGYAKGEIASKKVLELLNLNINKLNSVENIEDIISKIKNSLNVYVKEHQECFGMGSTLTGICISNNRMYLFNVGDSRVYKYKNKNLVKLTKDHSIVQLLVDLEKISEEEMRTHPRKNVVTSALIGNNNEKVAEISVSEIEIEKDSIYFLCSDGIWESLSNFEIEKFFLKEDISIIIENIFKQSLKNKAQDNITAIILKIKEF